MAVTKQQLAQWSREFAAKNPDKVSGAGSTAQNTTTKKSSVTKEQLSQWSREFDKKEAQRQAEQEQMPEAAARALDMGQKWGVPAKGGNVLENVDGGAMAYGSGRAQELRASFAKDSVPDEFDRINQ